MNPKSQGGELRLRLLGPPSAEVDGHRVTFDTRKALALVSYLEVAGGSRSRDHLAAFLWPEGDIAHGRGALRRTLSSLRKHLSDVDLVADRNAVELKGGAVSDVSDFRTLVGAVSEHHEESDLLCDECVTRLDRAVALFQGSFMEGFELRDAEPFDQWRFVQDETLRKEVAFALQRTTTSLAQRGDRREAIASATRWVELDPLHEPAHVELIRLHALNDDRTAALEQYRKLVRILDEELGVTPLEETIALERAIASGSVAAERKAPAADGRRSYIETPFVGRAAESSVLSEALTLSKEAGGVVIVEGEAGVGKTRLAREMTKRASVEGATVIEVASHEEERDHAYGLIARLIGTLLDDLPARTLNRLDDGVISEVSRLAPEIRSLRPELAPPTSLTEPGAKSVFFQALWEFFAAACDRHTVVVLDDVHWSDDASQDLIAYFARRLEEVRVLLLMLWRAEEMPRDHRLRKVTVEPRRSRRLEQISLARLQPADVERILQTCVPTASPGTTEQVIRESEGLPFFISEYVDLLTSGGEADEIAFPDSALDLIRARLDPIAGISRQVLTAASVLGSSFDFGLVQATAGRSDEETVDALEDLVGRGLLVETQGSGEPSYDFTHEKIRSLVYDDTSLARRRLLHGRAADMLTSPRVRTRPGDIALAAHHAEHAGRERDAAALHVAAGERARDLFANAEALTHFVRALALGHPEPAYLHGSIGEMQVLLGRYEAAVQSFQVALAYSDPSTAPNLERKLAGVRVRAGDDALAREHLERALHAVGEDDPLRPEILADASRAWSDADPKRAAVLAEQAVDSGARLDSPGAVARARNQLGLLARRAGDLEAATTHLARSLEAAEEDDDGSAVVAALNNLAQVHRQSGDLAEAAALTRRALEACARRGDVHREAALHNNLADLLHEMGQEESSQEHARAAAALFASVGDEPVTPPSIWRLTDW